MTIRQALSNKSIRRAMRDIKRREMIGTYASRYEIGIARALVKKGY
jgi:hypothetical protein